MESQPNARILPKENYKVATLRQLSKSKLKNKEVNIEKNKTKTLHIYKTVKKSVQKQ